VQGLKFGLVNTVIFISSLKNLSSNKQKRSEINRTIRQANRLKPTKHIHITSSKKEFKYFVLYNLQKFTFFTQNNKIAA